MIKPDIKKISVAVAALFLMTAFGCGKAGDQPTKAKKSFANPPAGVSVYRSRKEGKEARTVRYLLHKTAQKCIIANTYMRAVSKFKLGKGGTVAEFNDLMRHTRAAYFNAQKAALVTEYYAIGLIQLEKQKKGFSPYALETLRQEPFTFSSIAYAASDEELQKVYDNAKLGSKLEALAHAMGKGTDEAKKFLDSQPAKYQKAADINNALYKAQTFTNTGLKVIGLVGTAAAVATAAPTAGVGAALIGGVALTAGIVDTGLSIGNAVDVVVNDGKHEDSMGKVMFVTGAVSTVAGGTLNVATNLNKGMGLKEAIISNFKDDKDTIVGGVKGMFVHNEPGTALTKASKFLDGASDALGTASWYSDRVGDAVNLIGVAEENNGKTTNTYSSTFDTKNLSSSSNKERMSFMGFTQRDIDSIVKEAEKRRAAENKKTWRDLYKEAKSLEKQNAQSSSAFNNFVNGNYGDMVREFGGHPNNYLRLLENLLRFINVNNTNVNNGNVKTKHVITLTPRPGGAPAKPVTKQAPPPSKPKPAQVAPKTPTKKKKEKRHVYGTY